jgi:colanic acid biosynthesis glycosyl transferase WcaI
MRILFLTQWFQPEPIFKGLPFAKALADQGHKVEVLTGFPNYPGGTLYPGYRMRLWQREWMSGIRVNRVALYPSHDHSAPRRMLNYLSFALTSLILGPWLVQRPEIIYVYNLVTLGPTAFLLRRLYGARVILDVQDLWPESVAKSGMLRNAAALHWLDAACRWVYRRADCLTALSPGFKQALVNRSIPPGRIAVVYNWCDEASLGAEAQPRQPAQEVGPAGKFHVVFAGTMGTVQGLDTVLDCAQLCRKRLPNVQFVLVGGGVDRPRLEMRAGEMGLDNVRFLPRRTVAGMRDIYALADALLVHLKKDPLSSITIPSKTQAYLFMGKPIIMAVSGDAAELVKRSGAGVICEPDNPQAMADAVHALVSMKEDERTNLGRAGARYYEEALSMKTGVNQFEQLMDSLLA